MPARRARVSPSSPARSRSSRRRPHVPPRTSPGAVETIQADTEAAVTAIGRISEVIDSINDYQIDDRLRRRGADRHDQRESTARSREAATGAGRSPRTSSASLARPTPRPPGWASRCSRSASSRGCRPSCEGSSASSGSDALGCGAPRCRGHRSRRCRRADAALSLTPSHRSRIPTARRWAGEVGPSA